jgi:pre-mRNA-processing factor 40
LFLSSLANEEKEDSRFEVSPQRTNSDRQLLFADFVIELQAAEDDKRRRIRDARRRAEKAQREAYRDVLKRLAVEQRIRPYTQWRIIEEFVTVDGSFNAVLAQDRDAPREIYEEFIDTWDDIYRRERAFLSRFINPPDKKEINIDPETSFEDFSKLLLAEAEYSAELYGDARRIINREDPVSSVRLYWEELVSRASHSNGRQGAQRTSLQEDSSEDEGEIIEDGEVGDGGELARPTDSAEESKPPEIVQDNSGEETRKIG